MGAGLLSNGGVGRGLNAYNAALCRAGFEHLVALKAAAVPEGFCAHMGDKDGLCGCRNGVQSGLGAAVGAVDGHADLVHTLHNLSAKCCKAAVPLLLQAVAQSVGLAVSNAHEAHAKAVEDIHPVHLVFEDCRPLDNGDPGDLALGFCTEDV